MASSMSRPSSSSGEHFNKAKKHLWASDPPTKPLALPWESGPDSKGSHDESDSHSDGTTTSGSLPSPQLRSRPELLSQGSPKVKECILEKNRHGSDVRKQSYFTDGLPLPIPRLQGVEGWRAHGKTGEHGRWGATSENRQESQGRYSVSLSVFSSPTATYMWPNQFQFNGNHPVIYVNYNKRTQAESGSSISTPHHSPLSSAASPPARVASTLPQKRKSVSQDECISSDLPPSQSQRPDTTLRMPHRPPSAGSEDDYRTSREGSPPVSETSERSMVAHPVIRRPSPKGTDVWERYAKPTLTPDGTTRRWQCTWTTTESGKTIECKYTSKKQLVKRHVETTHLRFKPFVCEVCKKGFPQKTSLDTHMHGHTGSTPHVCRYGCGMAFKDPARRHRHMVEEHGYIPRQSKKRPRSAKSDQEVEGGV